MEDHEKKMQNLLKKVHDLGGTATDAQFRQIIISSMPSDWRCEAWHKRPALWTGPKQAGQLPRPYKGR